MPMCYLISLSNTSNSLLVHWGEKNLFILPLKWDIIFWDTHNTFLRLKGKCTSFSSHSDDIVRKQADKLWWNHSQCLMFLVKFFIGIYIWYTPEMEITYSFLVSDVFFKSGISSISYLDGKSKVITLFLHTKVCNFPSNTKVFFLILAY